MADSSTSSERTARLSARGRRCVLLAGLLALGSACSVGVGEGSITAQVTDEGCGMDGETVELFPDFFAADPFEGALEVRVQRGGDFEFMSDGISLNIQDSAMEAMRTGTPIEVSPEAGEPLRMTIYLHDTCRVDRAHEPPVTFVATEGTITFLDVYAPDLDPDQLRTSASFRGVRFVDTSRPNERFAIVDAEFSFLFNRGRPAQRFP